MSALTLPAGSPPDAVVRYQAALLDALGDADPIDVLAATPGWCARIVEATDASRIHTPEAAGKWSVADVIHHLGDSESVWSYRLRRVLAEDRPRLDGYDQDLWARRLGYRSRAVHPSLDLFRAVRLGNLHLLARATPADRRRVGTHGERGEESVEQMIRLYAGHDVAHRRQITGILEAVAPEAVLPEA
ncbi:MAG: DinB family protein [Bacteroidota bacterium]